MPVESTRNELLHPGTVSYLLLLLLLTFFTLIGAYCAYQLEHTGHIISGMNNRVVWGLPHVFAISLVVAASGALNTATLASVIGQQRYKPLAGLSVVLAISLLLGGLAVLVLDLGRPDRLFIAMTTYNYRSIFSWNIFLYIGFIVVGLVYLWVMLERRLNRFTKSVGVFALLWRIVLTTGTGSIFGLLVGHSALAATILALLFIALSFVLGTAAFGLVLVLVNRLQGASLSDDLLRSLARVLIGCTVALLFISMVQHFTNPYVSGPFSALFWLGHIGVGITLPILLLVANRTADQFKINRLSWACASALLGGMALVYVIVVGLQTPPRVLFPGKTIIASSFGDAGNASYQATIWEWGIGLGGISLSLLLFFLILRVLPLTPRSS